MFNVTENSPAIRAIYNSLSARKIHLFFKCQSIFVVNFSNELVKPVAATKKKSGFQKTG